MDYFTLDRDNKQEGPFSFEELQFRKKAGLLSETTFLWTDGLKTWIPLEQLLKPESDITGTAQMAQEFRSKQVQSDPPPYTGYNLVSAYSKALKNYQVCEGRATRSEYWFFQLASLLISIVLEIGLSIFSEIGFGSVLPLIGYWLTMIFFIILPGINVGIRRLHDIGSSGWNYLWILLPLIGQFYLAGLACMDSQKKTNKYGPSEKYPIGY